MPERTGKIRLLLVDDHAMFRDGLKMVIAQQPDMEVVGEAESGEEALQKAAELNPDVILMDIQMSDVNGTQATYRLKQTHPQINILAVTIFEDRVVMQEVLKAGATGYIPKRAAAEDLVYAIRTVARGGVYLDPYVIRQGAEESQSTNPNFFEREAPLSAREREIFCMVAQSYSNREIADQLKLSIKTVETYKYRSMEKLGCRTRSEVFRYAMHKGWLKDQL